MKTATKHIYLLGFEFDASVDEATYQDNIATQRISKADFLAINKMRGCLELVYENDELSAIYEVEGDYKQLRKPKATWKQKLFRHKKRYYDAPENILQNWIITEQQTSSYLGGMPSNSGFIFPTSKIIQAPFQHTAELDIKAMNLNLSVTKLNIVFPLYATLRPLFLDYSNPLEPRIINDTADLLIEYPFGEIERNKQIVFEQKYLKKATFNQLEDDENVCLGAPIWVQNSNIPISPKTGKAMRFLAQIATNKQVKTLSNSIETTYDYFKYSAQYLNFGGDGTLFIFYEAETNLLCLFEQIT